MGNEERIAECVAECCGVVDCVGLVLHTRGTILKSSKGNQEHHEGFIYINVHNAAEVHNAAGGAAGVAASNRMLTVGAVAGVAAFAVLGLFLRMRRSTITLPGDNKGYEVVFQNEL